MNYKKYVKAKKELVALHGEKCTYCGDSVPFNKLHLDHVYPKALGGRDYKSNLKLACIKCNSSKGNLTLPEWAGMIVFHMVDAKERYLYKKRILDYLTTILGRD